MCAPKDENQRFSGVSSSMSRGRNKGMLDPWRSEQAESMTGAQSKR